MANERNDWTSKMPYAGPAAPFPARFAARTWRYLPTWWGGYPGAEMLGWPTAITSRSAHIPLASLPPTREAIR
jgi:hypothetical protein